MLCCRGDSVACCVEAVNAGRTAQGPTASPGTATQRNTQEHTLMNTGFQPQSHQPCVSVKRSFLPSGQLLKKLNWAGGCWRWGRSNECGYKRTGCDDGRTPDAMSRLLPVWVSAPWRRHCAAGARGASAGESRLGGRGSSISYDCL